MAIPLKEFLRRLRAEGGDWSYAIFWKAVQRGNSHNLVWGEGDYGAPSIAGPDVPTPGCEGAFQERSALSGRTLQKSVQGELGGQEVHRIAVLVENTMKPKVHDLGYGILGAAALTGHHRWIVHGTVSSDAYNTQSLAEFSNQWFSGIQTIAVIPVLPHGVIQLGSTQMMMENLEFVTQTRRTFVQLSCTLEPPFSENSLRRSLEKGQDSVISLTNVNHQNPQNLDSGHPMQASVSSLPEQKSHPNMNSVFGQFGEQHSGSVSHYTLSDLSMMSNKQLVAIGLRSDNQCKSSNGAQIPSDSPVSLQQLFSCLQSQNIRYLEHSMHNAGVVQPSFNGLPVSSCSTTSIVILPSGRGEPSKNENVDGNLGPLPGRINSNATTGFENKLSQLKASGILESTTTSSTGHPMASAIDTRVSSETICYAASAPVSRGHKIKGDPLQTQISHNDLARPLSSVCSDVSSHEIGGMPGTSLQARRAPPSFTCDQRTLFLDDRNGCLHNVKAIASVDVMDEDVFKASNMCSSRSDLFDVLGLNQKFDRCTGNLAVSVKASGTEDDCKSGVNDSTYMTQLDNVFSSSHCVLTSEDLIDNRNDELLDAVVSRVNCAMRQDAVEASCRTSLTRITGSSYGDDCFNSHQPDSTRNYKKEFFNPSPRILQTDVGGPSTFKSTCSLNEIGECSRIEGICNSQNNFWVDVDNENIKNETTPAHSKVVEDLGKASRKRPKPGENPKPRPKDRQMIQDRLKELREIVPNGAKLSIDALLEHTIKHMLFLQSVTKHADKLKETREPKIISEEGGLLLKDNFEGGATWAFEVGSQSMICPIIVEDLNPPRQLLVEMLCEQRGLFLEIADLIKGLGLTILKGVMEDRNDKVWARFAVEANRDVTRMDIFLSLVQLLEPRAVSSVPQQHFGGINMSNNVVSQPIAANCAVNPLM